MAAGTLYFSNVFKKGKGEGDRKEAMQSVLERDGNMEGVVLLPRAGAKTTGRCFTIAIHYATDAQ